MSGITKTPAAGVAKSRAAAFLETVKAKEAHGGRGRLIFGLDATASRQPTWNSALQLQADMFYQTAAIGGLDVQIVYYRGSECQHSRWKSRPEELAVIMEKIRCVTGHSQIAKILGHAKRETEIAKVQALAFVGDAFEENLDDVASVAGELGRLSTPAFMFQEGDDPEAKEAFQKIARLTGGAYARFDAGSGHQLAALLHDVAVYAVGGADALKKLSSKAGTKLIEQLK